MKKRILFLDDNQYEMQGFADRLRSEEFDVTSFVEADKAIQFLREKGPVDLLIVDLIMRFSPEESVDETHLAGVHFCKQVRELLKFNTPIIILTVLTEVDALRKASEFAKIILNKPVLPGELVKRVREALK